MLALSFATAVADGARAWVEREGLALTVQPYRADRDDFTAMLFLREQQGTSCVEDSLPVPRFLRA